MASNEANSLLRLNMFIQAFMAAAGTSDPDRIMFQTMTFGSININVDMAGSPGDDNSKWADDTTNNLGNMNVAGLSAIVSSTTTQNIQANDDSSVNLGLLLGVSIPLVVLRKPFNI